MASQVSAAMYFKWMLCYEDTSTATLWIAKATPREWLSVGEAPIRVSNLTTRYGRLSYSIRTARAEPLPDIGTTPVYTVQAALALPAMANAVPAGGLRLRLRVMPEYKGKMRSVTVGGQDWSEFDRNEETVIFSAKRLSEMTRTASELQIVAQFG